MAPRRKNNRSTKIAANLAALLVLSLFAWGAGLFRFADTLPTTLSDQGTQTDAIVVLTGGSERLSTGLDLLEQGAGDRLFISGVYRGLDVNQLLEVAKRDPSSLGDKIGIGNAVDTVENANETARWMSAQGYSSLRLVTAAYHMPRSLLEFRAMMPDVRIVPHPVFPAHVKQEEWWAWPGTASLIVNEYNKTILAWVRHRLLSGLNLVKAAA